MMIITATKIFIFPETKILLMEELGKLEHSALVY